MNRIAIMAFSVALVGCQKKWEEVSFDEAAPDLTQITTKHGDFPELDALCWKQEACESFGRCSYIATAESAREAQRAGSVKVNECKAGNELSCLRSKFCTVAARCTFDEAQNECVIGRGDCRKSDMCKVAGLCAEREWVSTPYGRDSSGTSCVAASVEDCKATVIGSTWSEGGSTIDIRGPSCWVHHANGVSISFEDFISNAGEFQQRLRESGPRRQGR